MKPYTIGCDFCHKTIGYETGGMVESEPERSCKDCLSKLTEKVKDQEGFDI